MEDYLAQAILKLQVVEHWVECSKTLVVVVAGALGLKVVVQVMVDVVVEGVLIDVVWGTQSCIVLEAQIVVWEGA